MMMQKRLVPIFWEIHLLVFRQKLTSSAKMNLKYLLFSKAKNVDFNETAR